MPPQKERRERSVSPPRQKWLLFQRHNLIEGILGHEGSEVFIAHAGGGVGIQNILAVGGVLFGGIHA